MERLRIYRFQKNKFYGGVSTAFCGECNINCVFCYSQNQRDKGKFMDAEEIGQKLIDKASQSGVNLCRISGGDPFEKYKEFIKVVDYVLSNSPYSMMVETNGIEIGKNEDIARELSKFPKDRLFVRVSVKHIDPEKFAFLTGADPELAKYPMQGLIYLKYHDVDYSISWMDDWFTPDEFQDMVDFLVKYELIPVKNAVYLDFNKWFYGLDMIDPEWFRRYPSVKMSKKEIKEELGMK